jgi:hypothetical protein
MDRKPHAAGRPPVDAQQAEDRQGMPRSPRRGQGADAATVSVRATSAGAGTRVLAGALSDAEAVGDAELDGAGGGAVEPDFGREWAMRPVGAVAVIHGTLGAANAGGELCAWGFDLTVTSGKTDGAGPRSTASHRR